MTDESKPVAIVTGGSGVFGAAICAGMAEHGFAVVMVGRSERRLSRVGDRVRASHPDATVRIEAFDVSRAAEVAAFSRRWTGRLDVLINNAAIAPRVRTETPEGIEMKFATNVLGYVWMMRAFEKFLMASAPARVVNVASYWAGDLRMDDLQFDKRRYNNDTAYRQSKQADRMLTVAFAKRFASTGIAVNSCHPGDASSTLSNDLGYGGSDSPAQAAETPVWLASDPSLAGVTGKYFASRRERACEFASDEQSIAALDSICATFQLP